MKFEFQLPEIDLLHPGIKLFIQEIEVGFESNSSSAIKKKIYVTTFYQSKHFLTNDKHLF